MGLRLEEGTSLGTATTPNTASAALSRVRLGARPHPWVCAREKVRDRGGQKVEKGEWPKGSPSGCAGVSHQAGEGPPAGSLPQQMASPAPAALSRAHTAAGNSGQLPKPGGFCSQRPRHRFARCHTGICHKQDGRLILSTNLGRRSRLPQG